MYLNTRSSRKISFSILFIIVFISSLSLFIGTFSSSKIFTDTKSLDGLQTSGITYHDNVPWIVNPTFIEPVDPWYSTIEGDVSDASPSTSPNQANFVVIGNSGQYTFAETPDETWTVNNDPEWGPLPNLAFYNNNYSTDKYGAFLTYTWDEDGAGGQLGQLPSVQWKKTIPNVPVNMLDYVITSASLKVMFNATVQATNHANGGIDCPGDTVGQFYNGDFVRFYVKLSDPNNSTRFTQAYNQSRYLGQDARADGDGKDHFPDSILSPSESRLIGDLESLFELNHTSLTILIGINIFCEDNNAAFDHDYWEKLRIKYVNLTFTYEKRIDQFTAVSWNQDLNAVNRIEVNSTIQITDANLNFKFKIDQNWTEASQNSRIRIFINDRRLLQTISLIDYVYSPEFQDAQISGFNVTSKILPFEEFTLSIQVYLAENFGLDHNITVSITDVYLSISWIESWTDPSIQIPEPWIFLALLILVSAAAVCLGSYFIAYQRVLKYPRPVRKVRKYRRTLNRSSAPNVLIMPRDKSFKKSYKSELGDTSKMIKLKPSPSKIATEKGEFAGQLEKTMEKKINSDQLIKESLEKKSELDKIVDKSLDKS
ncbi:MAG: hypothetical protein ACFE9M_01450 [Promethearchaeota archaeon]